MGTLRKQYLTQRKKYVVERDGATKRKEQDRGRKIYEAK